MLGIAKQGTKQMDGEKGEIVWAVRAWGSFISLPEERREEMASPEQRAQ